MLLANGKNMQNDVLISSAVLIGLFFIIFMKLPILDHIIAMAVSLWIMKVAMQMFLQTNVELMDGMKDPLFYCELFDAVKKVKGANNPSPCAGSENRKFSYDIHGYRSGP